MYSFQTLQDFVLNLLNDEAARNAYAADPLGTLADAGLGDLTPQDVEEVVPLVTDALPTETPLGDLDLDIDSITDGSGTTGVSAIGTVEDVAYGGALVNQDADGVDIWAGAQSAGRLAGVVQTDGDFAEGGVSTPAVYAGANSHGDYLVTTADPAEVLDSLDDLGDHTDTAAVTATHMIATGAGTLAGAVDTGADGLAGFLAGTPAAPAADVVTDGADMLNEGIVSGAGMVNSRLADLPSTGDLPVDLPDTDDLPVDLPDLPDVEGRLGETPNVGDLDLPAQLPDLPIELPELGTDASSVTNMVSDTVSASPVSDAVSSSPVGGLTDTVSGTTGDLPVVGDLTDDLNLGL